MEREAETSAKRSFRFPGICPQPTALIAEAGREDKMSFGEAMLGIAVTDGLYAQRKLDGDKSIYGPNDHDALQAIVSQGKVAEGVLRRNGGEAYIRAAYRRAGQECRHQE